MYDVKSGSSLNFLYFVFFFFILLFPNLIFVAFFLLVIDVLFVSAWLPPPRDPVSAGFTSRILNVRVIVRRSGFLLSI